MHSQLKAALLAALVLACGARKDQGESTGETAPVNVAPNPVELQPRRGQGFALSPSTVQVSWSVTESTGGTVSQAGSYTAPVLSGTFHVVATSTADPKISGSAVVTVDSGVRISAVSPVSAFACEAVSLSATVTGSTDTTVVWSTPATCGTVTNLGVFTSARGSGPCLVTAQAHADAAQTATITVNVASERVLSVAVVPATVNLATGASQSFTANVTTACGTFPAGT